MDTELVMEALEQAWWARKPQQPFIHHSDRGSQYTAIRYTDRLSQQDISVFVGTTGDAYDNALSGND